VLALTRALNLSGPARAVGVHANRHQSIHEKASMSSIFKKVEIVGVSKTSFATAISDAVEEAAKSIRNMSWFEVVEQRGRIQDGKIAEYQVTLRIGFKLER
jgi:flavin-binding protein dodecin